MAAPLSSDEFVRRRKRARRTARVIAFVAVGIYAAFILSGVLRA